jgi:hypothetical protein
MRVDLTTGAYVARSIVANDQRCVNLFLEESPGGGPFPTAHYPAPGLKLLGTAPDSGWRCLFRSKTSGQLYGVCGQTVYLIEQDWSMAPVGTIGKLSTPVSMADNGFSIFIVDGSPQGRTIDLTTQQFATVVDPAFYGSTRVDQCDTYFVFNRPGTNNYYISLTQSTGFDPLDIAAKASSPDYIQVAIVMHDEIWLIGRLSTEVHYDTGASDFTFGKMPGVFIEHGTVAPYSVCKYDLSIYWLSQNEAGDLIVLRGNNYAAERISTHAIEAEFGSYETVEDCIAFVFQMGGHAFVQFTFPTADKTWVYDQSTEQWHEREWIDGDGAPHRHRANCSAFAYGKNICGDWENGNLYEMDLETYTDNGAPITYIRSFPHMVEDGNRVTYQRFIADMEVGTFAGTETGEPPMISLRWSDDRGATYGDAVEMPLGSAGQYDTSIQWWQLGMARDRVFELSWSIPTKTALNGAWLETKPHKS